ncbi:MAG: DNA methyltransferase [Chloroflexi bacterium]|nr:DNA methyltransferase [Chloroflexota bacterium]
MKRYGVIIADPPWRYGGAGPTFEAADHQYPTMSPSEIMALPVRQLAADDSVLLLWATWPQLNVALNVIRAWGFKYVTGFPWVKIEGAPQQTLWGKFVCKPVYGLGFWVRGCSEAVLIGRRGNVSPPDGDFVGILSGNFGHSRKPDNLYEYAEQFPGPYLELFARRVRPGWDVWGNEVESNLIISGRQERSLNGPQSHVTRGNRDE